MKIKTKGILLRLFLLAFLAMGINSCSKDSVENSEEIPISNGALEEDLPSAGVKDLKIKENVIVVNETINENLRGYSEKRLTFLNKEVINFEIGQILNSRPSTLAKNGYNVKITNVNFEKNLIIYDVVPVGIDDVIDSGDFNYNISENVYDENSTGNQKMGPNLKPSKTADLDFFAILTKDIAPFTVNGILQGVATFGISYKTPIPFRNKSYIKTYVGIDLVRDPSIPDLSFTLGGSGELDLLTIPLGRFGFTAGPIWIWFGNKLRVSVTSDTFINTNISNTFDFYGKAWVEIEQEGKNAPSIKAGNSIQVDMNEPDINNLVNGTIILGLPSLTLESKLYNTDAFVFYGQFNQSLVHLLDPFASDYRLKVNSEMDVRAGIKGEIAKLKYNIFLKKVFNKREVGNYFPVE